MQPDSNLRYDRTLLVEELEAAGGVVHGTSVRCPYHDDKTASGSIHNDDGVWRYTCHTSSCSVSGDVFDMYERRTGEKVFVSGQNPERKKPERVFASPREVLDSFPNRVASYVYMNADRSIALIVIRTHDKKFFQASPKGKDAWVLTRPQRKIPVYRLPEIIDEDEIVVVEGEKDAKNLAALGIPATTSSMGAKNAGYTDWKPLAGKTVILWPDHDTDGQKYAEKVAQELSNLEPPAKVRLVDTEALDLPPKGDVSDVIAIAGEEAPGLVKSIVEGAGWYGPASGLREHLEAIRDGKRVNLPLPWPDLGENTQCMIPSGVTLLVGDPGAGKSLFALQAMLWCHGSGIKSAMYALEEDLDFHLQRILAVLSSESRLTKYSWVRDNPSFALDHSAEHEAALNLLAPRIWTAPEQAPRIADVGEWVKQRAADGFRVIFVDPITAAEASDKPWVDALKFVNACKAAARDHGCSIWVVSHPKDDGRPSLENLAGGKAYSRFAQTVLWLLRFAEDTEVDCIDGRKLTINCAIKILKARLGEGIGQASGMYFFGNNLQFGEQGLCKMPKRKR